MSVVYGLENVPSEPKGRAVAVGVFDGVHWGHKAIFTRLIAEAAEADIEPLVLTFEKHPAELLAPNRAPLYINTLDQRIELMQAVGVQSIVVADFNPALAGLVREDFLSTVLQERLRAKRVVVGANFRFGRNREGDIRYLSEVAPSLGMKAVVVPAVIINDGPVSSTRVRALIERGDVEAGLKLLGRRFALRGTVVPGKQIGRTIGFPTANIRTEPRQLIPARGVYAVEVTLENTMYTGVCNIGTRPTFGGDGLTVEVHIADFQGDIYGSRLDLVFCRKLRDEMAFETPESLAAQIHKDLQRANEACG
jgi:riboflavin kinase/FMN adenylyltransferase